MKVLLNLSVSDLLDDLSLNDLLGRSPSNLLITDSHVKAQFKVELFHGGEHHFAIAICVVAATLVLGVLYLKSSGYSHHHVRAWDAIKMQQQNLRRKEKNRRINDRKGMYIYNDHISTNFKRV